jgi:hypothetical protein
MEKNPDFIPLMKLLAIPLCCQKNGNQVAGYAALQKKFLCLHIKHMQRDKTKFQCRVTFRLAGTKIFSAPCIWANSEFLEFLPVSLP